MSINYATIRSIGTRRSESNVVIKTSLENHNLITLPSFSGGQLQAVNRWRGRKEVGWCTRELMSGTLPPAQTAPGSRRVALEDSSTTSTTTSHNHLNLRRRTSSPLIALGGSRTCSGTAGHESSPISARSGVPWSVSSCLASGRASGILHVCEDELS